MPSILHYGMFIVKRCINQSFSVMPPAWKKELPQKEEVSPGQISSGAGAEIDEEGRMLSILTLMEQLPKTILTLSGMWP